MDEITAYCPSGHRVRGPRAFGGRMVKCPKCAAEFLFVSPAPKTVTDTGVMRILGDSPSIPPPPPARSEPQTRPCPRCERAIALSITVCQHCACYVGIALPTNPPLKMPKGVDTDSLR
jgi:hypothetical protein